MRRFCEFVLDCQQAFHRECVSNSEKCTKDRKFTTTLNFNPSKPKKTQKNPLSTNQIICFSLFFDFLLIFIKKNYYYRIVFCGQFNSSSIQHVFCLHATTCSSITTSFFSTFHRIYLGIQWYFRTTCCFSICCC